MYSLALLLLLLLGQKAREVALDEESALLFHNTIGVTHLQKEENKSKTSQQSTQKENHP